MKKRSPAKRSRKETVFLRIKKNAKQLVSVFLKVLCGTSIKPPTSPARKGNFSREYDPDTIAAMFCQEF